MRLYKLTLLITMVLLPFLSVPLHSQEEQKEQQLPAAVGTWELAVNWGKGEGEKTGNHILTITRDLKGEIKDVDEGWTASLRNLKVNERALAFSFYYESVPKNWLVCRFGFARGNKFTASPSRIQRKTTRRVVLLSTKEW